MCSQKYGSLWRENYIISASALEILTLFVWCALSNIVPMPILLFRYATSISLPPPHCYFLQALVPREFLTQLLKQSSLNSIFKNGLSHVTLASLVSALSILIVSPAWCSVHSVYVLSFSDFSLTLTFSMAIHSASLR